MASIAVLVATLTFEGAYSAFTGASLLRPRASVRSPAERDDADRLEAAKRTVGAFARDADPLVGFRMKGRRSHPILGTPATTDAHGQRTRVGPVPVDGAPRIVVLGDSVAFGFGLADDAVLAHRLEELLAAGLAPGALQPSVHTIASPAWTGSNALRYLRDHLHRLKPDVVLYVPVANDLDDPVTVDEAGHTVYASLPGNAAPHVSRQVLMRLVDGLGVKSTPRAVAALLATGRPEAIAHVVTSGLTPESIRRWEAWMEDLADLAHRLERRERRFAVVLYSDEPFQRLFHAQAARHLPSVPLVPGFREFGLADRLEGDAHPNAGYVDALAHALAEFLAERGWVPGVEPGSTPPLSEGWQRRRASLPDAEEARRRMEETHALQHGFLAPEIDLRVAGGLHQIYAGVHPDGYVGPGFFAALRNTGARSLHLQGERPRFRDTLYPLTLTASANGLRLGTARLTTPAEPDEPFDLRFPLPQRLAKDPYLDVEVRVSDWVARKHEGSWRLESFRLSRLSTGE